MNASVMRMLEHGGRLRQAAASYGIPLANWLDLSTGINPHGWPVPTPPATSWQRLPEDDDGLEKAASAYYGNTSLLPVAGSQAAIQALPRLRQPGEVAILHPGYAEHAAAWRRAGHRVRPIAEQELAIALPSVAVLVVIHPGNPTGARFPRDQLLSWHAQLAARGGWLIVDEAFIDTTPEDSLADLGPRPGLILLRSLGKFFGLAGARVGFLLAEPQIINAINNRLGPWPIAAPARWIAQRALADQAWQADMRQRLPRAARRLAALLARHGLSPSGGCALFQWVETADASRRHEALARQGLLTRLFTDPPSLRFGLPGDESAWARLDAALGQAMASTGLPA